MYDFCAIAQIAGDAIKCIALSFGMRNLPEIEKDFSPRLLHQFTMVVESYPINAASCFVVSKSSSACI